MGSFPKLWSWAGKSSNSHAERWTPLSRIYPPRKVPSRVELGGAQWLCSGQHITDSVTCAFGACGELPFVPNQARPSISTEQAGNLHLSLRE
jgi:hypothetical protein